LIASSNAADSSCASVLGSEAMSPGILAGLRFGLDEAERLPQQVQHHGR
jgi:hypothetical protein